MKLINTGIFLQGQGHLFVFVKVNKVSDEIFWWTNVYVSQISEKKFQRKNIYSLVTGLYPGIGSETGSKRDPAPGIWPGPGLTFSNFPGSGTGPGLPSGIRDPGEIPVKSRFFFEKRSGSMLKFGSRDYNDHNLWSITMVHKSYETTPKFAKVVCADWPTSEYIPKLFWAFETLIFALLNRRHIFLE